MELKKVKIIFFKEMLDTLRDRRTLFAMILVPLILFPVLGLGFGSLATMVAEKTEKEVSRITVIGSEYVPSLFPQLKENKKFELMEEKDYRLALKKKTLQAALEFPKDFEKKIENEDSAKVTIYYDGAEFKSEIAGDKIERWLTSYKDSVVEERLKKRDIEQSLLQPIEIKKENVASKEKMGGFMLSMFLPYMIVILALTGAMYPAIDLTAGEKERGTLETLLVSPASRGDIATGKFLTVLTASIVTSILATLSMTLSMRMGMMKFDEMAGQSAQFSLSLQSILVILLLLLPISALFSSALLSISLLAKSFKEAQNYITPLMIMAILPAMISILPGVELNWEFVFIPVVNVCLALKEFLLGTYRWGFVALIFLSTAIYASFSIYITKKLFEKEGVLFRT
jgi:sodium transport system permease protein